MQRAPHMQHRTLVIVAFLVAVVIGVISPARAQDNWAASAYKGWSVTSVEIRGVDKPLAGELRGGLALAVTSGLLGAKRAEFYPQTLDRDIKRTLLFLARRGYPHAKVTPVFEPSTRRESLRVILDIERGPPVIITEATVSGLPPSLEEKGRNITAQDIGSVFTDRRVAAIATTLDSFVTYSGYARATVASNVVRVDSIRAAIRFDVKAGTLYYFGDVTALGTSEDIVPLIKKTAAIERGRRYSPDVLQDAQRNLRILGLFRQVRFQFEDAANDTLDIVVQVVMQEPRSFETSARYWTDDGLSGDVRWTHRNMFKRGRGMKIIVFGSVVRQLAQVSSWWPAIFWARSRGSAALGSIRESEDAYESVSTGIDLSLRHEFTVGQIVRVGVSLTNEAITSRSTDPGAIPEGDGRLLALIFGWDRFAGNHPIVATEGTLWKGLIEWAPPGGISKNQYIRGSTSGVLYVPLLPKANFATRLTFGLGEPIGTSTEIIPNKRFYSGGANSMRGFDRRKLGPLDSAGNPLGGNSFLEASFEFRFPVVWRFRGTLFVDTGQVWERQPDLGARKIEVAVGPGLWIDTPIGPIRGDVGYRLTDWEPSQPRYVFHFSIGPSY